MGKNSFGTVHKNPIRGDRARFQHLLCYLDRNRCQFTAKVYLEGVLNMLCIYSKVNAEERAESGKVTYQLGVANLEENEEFTDY